MKKILSLILTVSFMVLLSGCGSAGPLKEYQSNMTRFFDDVSAAHRNIAAIDPSAADAPAQLLHHLDNMNAAFTAMKDYPVPDEFSSIKNLKEDAVYSMQSANDYYHKAYDGAFDSESADLAKQYYDRAQKCVEVMGKVLRGEDPSGDGVKVTY